MKFVSLHHHSTFSYMDGYGTPAEHVARAADLGMGALALTEHGNPSSHVQLEKAARKAGIKPIFGLEAYTHPEESRRKFHLTILAADATGYRNLMHLVTRSWAENFYQWPTVNGEILADHEEGLIVLSGCADSLLACSLLGGKTIEPADASYERMRGVALRFRELLGDRYYLETQMFPELERTRNINAALERLSGETGIPLVATADVHYPMPDDNVMQLTLHAAGRGAADVAKQAEGWEYEIKLTLPTSDKKALKRLRGAGLSKRAAAAALAATGEIAERCNVVLPKADRLRFPVADVAPGMTADQLIWEWLRAGWRYRIRQGNRRMAANREEYALRLKYEMGLITAKDFIDYFLATADLVAWAKDQGIPVGPARGSAAASLVCYLLRITEIDPLEYPLMSFERFVALDREDIPDIDLDFDDERRGEIRDRAVYRYGETRVGNVATFTRYRGKSAIDDVARVHRVPRGVTEVLKDMIVERSGGDSREDQALADTIEMFPQAKEIVNKHKALRLAPRLEGNYRGMSVHAAGLLISNTDMADVCALYTREDAKGNRRTAASVDKKDAEYLRLMKMDFLGLSTLGMIRIALEEAGLTLEELYRVPMDDPETMAAFQRNDVIGIFQFEGRATRLVCRSVRPDTFLELSDINGLSRPGPLFSGTTTEYIAVKWGDREAIRYHPLIDALTAPTKGQIIYQEQVLAALKDFGGLPVARVHDIRRIISQKLGEAQFNASAQDFIDGAMALHGVSADTAKAVWGKLVTSATYSFNIAHCVSYSMLAFWCMWMKVHHPRAFYMAQLRKIAEDNWPRLIKDAEQHGVTVRGVTPGRSAETWKVDDGEVVAGWRQLKGVGEVTAGRIVDFDAASRRAGGPGITGVGDLLDVSGIGPVTVEKFRHQIDTDDPFGLLRVQRALDRTRDEIRSGALPLSTFPLNSDGIREVRPKTPIAWLGFVRLIEMKDYLEDMRARYGKTPEEIRAEMDRPDRTIFCVLHGYDDGDEDVYVRINRYEYPKWRQAVDSITVGHDLVYIRGVRSPNIFGLSIYVRDIIVIDPDG